jgi:copper transport protein
MVITDQAKQALQDILKEHGKEGIRLYSAGGGCCGPQLGLSLDGYLQRRSIKNLTSKAVNKVINRVRIELIYGVFILFFASLLVASTPSTAEQGVYPSSVEKEKVKLNVNISPLYPGLNVFTMNFNNKDIEKVEVTLSMPDMHYNVTYNAFKVDKGVFKLTGNLLHTAGTMNMNVKAKKFNGESINFLLK